MYHFIYYSTRINCFTLFLFGVTKNGCRKCSLRAKNVRHITDLYIYTNIYVYTYIYMYILISAGKTGIFCIDSRERLMLLGMMGSAVIETQQPSLKPLDSILSVIFSERGFRKTAPHNGKYLGGYFPPGVYSGLGVFSDKRANCHIGLMPPGRKAIFPPQYRRLITTKDDCHWDTSPHRDIFPKYLIIKYVIVIHR